MTDADHARFGPIINDHKRFMMATHTGAMPHWVLELDLTMAQFRALMIIVHTGGAHGRELATALGMSPSNISTIIDHLVERRLVYREEDAIDRRITHNRPTSAARELMERLVAAREREMTAILRRLAPDDLTLVERAFAALRDAAEAVATERQPSPATAATTSA